MSAAEPVCRRVVVQGRVQGVFFRESCRREAMAAGVAGWARNTENGSVEACFEGDANAVSQLVEWCRRGPGLARVTGVSVHDERPTGQRGFRVG